MVSEVKVKKKGFTLLELLVLLGILAIAALLAMPNMAMARNRAKLLQTIRGVHTVAVAIEASRVEHVSADFVNKVNQLNDLEGLTWEDCPWLVPKYLPPRINRTVWGGRLSYLAEAPLGRVNIGAPGRSGTLAFALTETSRFYELRSPVDFDHGVVFRDGFMIIGPKIADKEDK